MRACVPVESRRHSLRKGRASRARTSLRRCLSPGRHTSSTSSLASTSYTSAWPHQGRFISPFRRLSYGFYALIWTLQLQTWLQQVLVQALSIYPLRCAILRVLMPGTSERLLSRLRVQSVPLLASSHDLQAQRKSAASSQAHSHTFGAIQPSAQFWNRYFCARPR